MLIITPNIRLLVVCTKFFPVIYLLNSLVSLTHFGWLNHSIYVLAVYQIKNHYTVISIHIISNGLWCFLWMANRYCIFTSGLSALSPLAQCHRLTASPSVLDHHVASGGWTILTYKIDRWNMNPMKKCEQHPFSWSQPCQNPLWNCSKIPVSWGIRMGLSDSPARDLRFFQGI